MVHPNPPWHHDARVDDEPKDEDVPLMEEAHEEAHASIRTSITHEQKPGQKPRAECRGGHVTKDVACACAWAVGVGVGEEDDQIGDS